MNRKGEWSLSPAYDLTLSYNPNNIWLKAHQMSVNGKRTDITAKDIIACAAAMDIPASKCRAMIQKAEQAVYDFKKFAQEAYLPENNVHGIIKLLDRNRIRE